MGGFCWKGVEEKEVGWCWSRYHTVALGGNVILDK